MSVLRYVLPFSIFSSTCLFSFCQEEASGGEIKIDPRQYVTVQYRKTPTKGKLDTIWNWETRKDIPNQKFHFLDVDGEIKIDFDRKGLIENTNFEGTVSLEAEISGSDGTRKIEVNPYSEIGVQRVPIGVKSEPPSEIAKKLLNMIKELKDAESIYQPISFYRNFTYDDVIRNGKVQSTYKELDSLTHDPKIKRNTLIDKAVEFRRLIKRELDVFYFDDLNEYGKRWDSIFNSAKTNQELQRYIDAMYSDYRDTYSRESNSYIEDFTKAFNFSKEELGIVLNYLGSFDNSGEDAVKAFLSLINKDLVNYNALKSKLTNYRDEIDNIRFKSKNPDSVALALSENAPLLTQVMKSLTSFSRFKGSYLENILRNVASNKSEYNYTRDNYSGISQRDSVENKVFYSLLDAYTEELSDSLSKAAGKIIFRKLIYATIDLGKSGARDGEVLNVYVTWILDSRRDSLGNSPRVPIGKYYLRETGWKVEVADMFAMIKRLHESRVDPSKISPSNFKGSGGAVLMWTFNREDRGIKLTSNDGVNYTVKTKNSFANFFEPSFGLNVSYLDFSTEKDVEIGTGLQLGLFRNKIFVGYGVNLHMLSPKHQEPTYFYIGFSFAKLSDLFKNSGSVKVVN